MVSSDRAIALQRLPFEAEMASVLRPADSTRAGSTSVWALSLAKRRRTRIQAPCVHQTNAAVARASSDTSAIAAGTQEAAAGIASVEPVSPAYLPGHEDDTLLGSADLQAYMQLHGIAGAIVPPLNGAPAPPGCLEVKSLVFLVGSHPVVLVLPLNARADERRLAELLHTGRNRIKLAPAGSLVQLCGYSVGCVPPFGHRRPLPVIIDTTVTAYASCYAGGGSEDAEVAMAVGELVRAAGATVADISRRAAATHSGTASMHGDSAAADDGDGGSRNGEAVHSAGESAAAALPEPWRPGEVDVTIEGLIAQRRKIAKVLLFANLVPLDAAAGTAAGSSGGAGDGTGSEDASNGATGSTSIRNGSATFLRRLWRHPDSGEACEVQLIMGSTLERALGSYAAAELLRALRPGQAVRVTGRVQQHLQKSSGGEFRGPRTVCDVVVHSIQLIDTPPAAGAGAVGASTGGAGAGSTAGAGGTAASLPGGRAGAAGSAAPTDACYQLPAEVEDRLVLVDSEEGLLQLEAALFGSCASSTPSDAANGTASEIETQNLAISALRHGSAPAADTGAGYRLVVGLDAEWQPYGRDEAHTPVSLLQLATPDAVLLLDMLALCGGSAASMASRAASDAGLAEGGGNGVTSLQLQQQGQEEQQDAEQQQQQQEQQQQEQQQQQQQQQPVQQQLTCVERRLSDILTRLWGDASIIKAGFGLSTDLKRLCESYPHLPCCGGGEGPLPLRSYVDVLLLARSALGPRLPSTRRHLSLSALCELVLRRPLDKSQQCSEWGERPLSAAQLRYAAADAHALVALYRLLLAKRPGLQTPFWVSHLSGGLVDVAAFHPSKRASRRRSTRHGDALGTGVRRSGASGGADRQREGSVLGGEVRLTRLGQTQQLDVNCEYLMATYLGRQLPQGGKAAVVRAAAAHSGRQESGRTPSFPRGCGGLLEWRNAFLLFVSLPEAGRRPAYPNEFLWLPAADDTVDDDASETTGAQPAAGAAPAAARGATSPPADTTGAAAAAAAATAASSGEGAASAAAQADEALGGCSAGPQPAGSEQSSAGEQPAGLEQQSLERPRRLVMTWWPGRGRTLDHPAVQRLLAAAAEPAGGMAAADESSAAGPGGQAATAGDDGTLPTQQKSVLLFVRAGSSPYVFCGRLKLAALSTDSSSSSSSSSSSGGFRVGWELRDSPALLASKTFQGLLGH